MRSLTSLWTGRMQMVSCDDALCTTNRVFQEFRLERLYKNSCLWQRLRDKTLTILFCFLEGLFPLKREKLCNRSPFLLLFPGEDMD